jgi:mRNA interferase HigB
LHRRRQLSGPATISLRHSRSNKSSSLPIYVPNKEASWQTPAELKAHYRGASILKNSRAVFNIAGNKYRLVVRIRYDRGIVFIRFVGAHKEYDAIDVETI